MPRPISIKGLRGFSIPRISARHFFQLWGHTFKNILMSHPQKKLAVRENWRSVLLGLGIAFGAIAGSIAYLANLRDISS
jgi:hypothetical protein